MSTYLLTPSDAQRLFGDGSDALVEFALQDAAGNINFYKAVTSEVHVSVIERALRCPTTIISRRADLGDYYEILSICVPDEITPNNLNPGNDQTELGQAETAASVDRSLSGRDALSGPIDLSLTVEEIIRARREALELDLADARRRADDARRDFVKSTQLHDALKAELDALESSTFRNLHTKLRSLCDQFTTRPMESETKNRLPIRGYSYFEESPLCIEFVTSTLTCTREADGAEFSIGELSIKIDFETSDIIITAKSAPQESRRLGRLHPILNEQGRIIDYRACLALSEMVLRLEIEDMIRMIIDALTRIPEGDPSETVIEQWPRFERIADSPETIIVQDITRGGS